MKLVDLSGLLPTAIIDLRYATNRNILGEVLDASVQPLFDERAAQALLNAVTLFSEQDLRIVIWDTYRTPTVQQKLRRAVNYDERYVLEDSNHCKGLAIDLTLARPDGTYLDMGTDHDDFSPRAHANATRLRPEQLANRQLLAVTMQRAGFSQWPYEWWHFDYLPHS